MKILFFLFLSHSLYAALPPTEISRTPLGRFIETGEFKGGKAIKANLENLRFGFHKDLGYERWVLDFTEPTNKKPAEYAPKFLLRYQKEEKGSLFESKALIQPAKFILTLRGIQQNLVTQARIKKLVKKSHFVKEIHLYPPIEEGDFAIEITLKDNVLFETHQPIEKAGRLVLDLKNSPVGN